MAWGEEEGDHVADGSPSFVPAPVMRSLRRRSHALVVVPAPRASGERDARVTPSQARPSLA